MKRFHGLARARGYGLRSASFQAKLTALAVNLKRISKLISPCVSSDTKDSATIVISEPLSADSAEWESGRYAGYISNADAFTGPLEDTNFYADILDFALSKIHPLYNKVCEGDTIVTVRRHKGGYKGISQKEYKFYFGQDKSNFYYVK